MPLNLSKDELQKIADQLFLLKPEPKLDEPDDPKFEPGTHILASKLDPLAADDRFKDFGIGVIDFTDDATTPKIWLHNKDARWRIASSGKIAILLAAVQLRDDVRRVQDLKLIATPGEFDELFRMPKLWQKSKNSRIQQIAEDPPRISTIFDFTKKPVDFIGPDPDKSDRGGGIISKLPPDPSNGHKPLTWAMAKDFTFSERIWLAGADSDDCAADSCTSEIGLAYMKAVQRAYGLFDGGRKTGMLLAGPYYWELARDQTNQYPAANRDDHAPTYRPLHHPYETNPVRDFWWNSATGKFDDQNSWQPGTAAALTKYMIALMKDKLVDRKACETIRNNLGGTPDGRTCYIAQGVGDVARKVSKEVSKIGIHFKTPDGPKTQLNCEFAYLEATSLEGKALKFAVVATGLIHTSALRWKDLSLENIIQDLGSMIFHALL